jgi:hypothetical protein
MAGEITHLVVGERVFAELRRFAPTAYGAFLLGCVLPDVQTIGGIDRRATHFCGSPA